MLNFNKYLQYLEGIKDTLPKHIYDFIKNVNRHNLSSPHSLHDSWISSISIKENRSKCRPFDPKPTITIELLGPMHDRDIILIYTDVREYEIIGNKNEFNSNDTFHGDIAKHEIRTNNNSMEHIIWLQSNSKIRISFEDLKINENIHNVK